MPPPIHTPKWAIYLFAAAVVAVVLFALATAANASAQDEGHPADCPADCCIGGGDY